MINDQVLAFGNNDTILKYEILSTGDDKKEILRVYYPNGCRDLPADSIVSVMKQQKKQYSDIAAKLDTECKKIQKEIKNDTTRQINNLKIGGAINILLTSTILVGSMLGSAYNFSSKALTIGCVMGNVALASYLFHKGSNINSKRDFLDELIKNRLYLTNYSKFEDYNFVRRVEAESSGEPFEAPIELDSLDQYSLEEIKEALRESDRIRRISDERKRENLYIEKEDFTASAPKKLGKKLPFRTSPYENLDDKNK